MILCAAGKCLEKVLDILIGVVPEEKQRVILRILEVLEKSPVCAEKKNVCLHMSELCSPSDEELC